MLLVENIDREGDDCKKIYIKRYKTVVKEEIYFYLEVVYHEF
jgi:hypothetical protein